MAGDGPVRCGETWGDEVGCDGDATDHHCTVTEPRHRWHRCRCGAMVLEDKPRGDGQ